MAQIIHTYFEPLIPQSELVLAKFQRLWTKLGFEIRVHERKHAEAHPMYDEFMRNVEKIPTINAKDYELCCYRRWLAFDQNDASGWFVDYDVANMGLREMPDARETASFGGMAVIHVMREDVRRFVHTLMAFPPWLYEPHNSDQTIFMLWLCVPRQRYVPPLVRDYPDTSAPLVHYQSNLRKELFINLPE